MSISTSVRLSANQRALMVMSTMSSLNISISISIRKKLIMLMLVSLVRAGLYDVVAVLTSA